MEHQRRKKQKKKKHYVSNILIILIFITGAVILLYPTFSNAWNQYRNSKLISNYNGIVNKLDVQNYQEILEAAQEYNTQHTVNEIVDAFEDEEDYIISHPYDTLLNPAGDEVMGYLEIPTINIELTIYHGVGATALQQGCGHVEGTSLPIGGLGTHTVLAAHRGLPSAKLFTDLDQLEVGDVFYITVLNVKMAYEIDQIKTVLPSETEDLDIIDGKDYATLLTCTPYAVNTHRLLVRGRRIDYVEPDDNSIADITKLDSNLAFKLLIAGLFIFEMIVLLLRESTKKKGDKVRRKK